MPKYKGKSYGYDKAGLRKLAMDKAKDQAKGKSGGMSRMGKKGKVSKKPARRRK